MSRHDEALRVMHSNGDDRFERVHYDQENHLAEQLFRKTGRLVKTNRPVALSGAEWEWRFGRFTGKPGIDDAPLGATCSECGAKFVGEHEQVFYWPDGRVTCVMHTSITKCATQEGQTVGRKK